MIKKILLTGATGVLGHKLATALLSADHDIVALKRKSSSLAGIHDIAADIAFFDIEGINFEQFFSNCGKIDVIIHTATCYGRNNETVSEIFSANTEFPLRLLDAGNRNGVRMFFNTDTSLDKYLNLYSLSKNQLLQWGRFFSRDKKIRFGNIKLEHFYGPDDDPTKFSAYVINNCLANVPELKLTNGEQLRDFIHIDDVVSAYLILLENMDSFHDFFVEFDVGSGQSISIRQFVETVHRLTQSKTQLAFGALPYREGEVMYSEADTSALMALGWHCRHDIGTGLKQVIQQEKGRL